MVQEQTDLNESSGPKGWALCSASSWLSPLEKELLDIMTRVASLNDKSDPSPRPHCHLVKKLGLTKH
jgi:hypothetical protein